jgi:hypothetical protein
LNFLAAVEVPQLPATVRPFLDGHSAAKKSPEQVSAK